MKKVTPTIHTRVSNSDHREMEALAKKKGISLAALSREAFQEYLRNSAVRSELENILREVSELRGDMQTLTTVLSDNFETLQGERK